MEETIRFYKQTSRGLALRTIKGVIKEEKTLKTTAGITRVYVMDTSEGTFRVVIYKDGVGHVLKEPASSEDKIRTLTKHITELELKNRSLTDEVNHLKMRLMNERRQNIILSHKSGE